MGDWRRCTDVSLILVLVFYQMLLSFDLESANRFNARSRGSFGQRSRFGLRADASLKARLSKAKRIGQVDKYSYLMN